MRIRRGVAGDLPSILAAEKACFPGDLAFPVEALSFLLAEGTTIVAEDDDLVGFVIGLVEGWWGKVLTLDVLPERRRQGVAGKLVAALEEELASQGAGAISLEVSVENREAVTLYSSLGYRKAALLPSYYGRGIDGMFMVKRLE
ncbi:GNAT family N-acetyltransferase [Candidatus Methanocrinis natronophilus]|uniref:GNAT family N-acetyltransferase n=1 Tax=Candidatus Methanocrinis natronophilus TaxID=3033396 RepID=A0ABT5X5K4_9EURY|nr:GNAT family N-acetyltransferase [Candidatus Methanocrinis natronophilus]MDF0589980.1 GNAT family N-acetyltransferase [Candidatus Methanocrinis natronophilus]